MNYRVKLLLGGANMSKTQTKLTDFLKEVGEEDELHRTPDAEIENRMTLKAEFDDVYENYIVEGYTSDIASEFGGTNTAVRLTSSEGEKLTLWVGSFEQDHFLRKVALWKKQGHDLPVKISFARVKVPSKDGKREYNRLQIKTVAVGDDVATELQTL